MIKKILSGVLVAGTMSIATPVFADPTNISHGTNNPQVVAFYTSADHGIVDESNAHTGSDLVQQSGNSGNFQQWFTGTSTENGGNTEGDHSIWMDVGGQTSCNGGAILVPDANPTW